MYIRFFTRYTDEMTQVEKIGFFQVAINLRDLDILDHKTQDELTGIIKWFNKYLKEPSKFSNATRKKPKPQAICWFKDTAHESIKRAFQMKEILESRGIFVEIVRSNNPGYIVYEDDDQIAVMGYRENQSNSR